MDHNKLNKLKNIAKLEENQSKIHSFSIEQIGKSKDLINSIKYKYIDPKIKRKKNIIQNGKKSKRIQDKSDEEIYSARKIKYRKYINLKEINSNPLSFRQYKKNNFFLKLKKNEMKLPLIKNKILNESYKEIKKEEKDLLFTSGMMSCKKLNKNKKNKITIETLINIIRNKKNKLRKDDYNSFDNINTNNIKNKFTLNIENNNNFNHNISNNGKKKFERKLTKKGLLTNLYQKYSSINNNNI